MSDEPVAWVIGAVGAADAVAAGVADASGEPVPGPQPTAIASATMPSSAGAAPGPVLGPRVRRERAAGIDGVMA